MMPKTNRHKFNGEVTRVIKAKVSQLIERCGFRECDREDLQQEMYVELLARLPKFDPNRASLKSFTYRIIQSRARRLSRYRKSEDRNYKTHRLSLHDYTVNEHGAKTEYIDFVDRNYRLTIMDGLSRFFDSPIQDFLIDIKKLQSGMNEELTDLCELLRSKKVVEISRETGIPRGTLYDRISKIRKHLQEMME